MRNLIAKLFGYRYFQLMLDNKATEIRVDIFGKAQYLKYDPSLGLANRMLGQGTQTDMFWMNMVERNPKSQWVKDNK